MTIPRTVSTFAVAIAIVLAATLGIPTSRAHAAAPPRVVSETWLDKRTVDLAVSSPSIDQPTRIVRLLLPQDWAKTTTKSWPTLWLLHGGGDDYTSWTKNTDVATLTASHEMIVAMPDTSWCSAYSNWWNYGNYGTPAWETYITSELPKILATNYHANSIQSIAGLSMGGLGALKFPESHPTMYTAAASFSGNLDPLHSYNNTSDGPDLPGSTCWADWKRVWGDYTIPAQKAIWQQNDPYNQANKLASLKYLYISSGDGLTDPLHTGIFPGDTVEAQVNKESQAVAAKLQRLGIPATTHFGGGHHAWPYWQQALHSALPGILKAMNIN